MKTSDLILFDSNVLIYNQDIKSPFYRQASDYHEKAYRGDITAVISSQNIAEFSSVMLNPKKVPNPLTPTQLTVEINNYLALEDRFTLIYPNRLSLNIFSELVKSVKFAINPMRIFDFFLIATMLGNNISTLLTANTKDFALFPQIKIIDLSKQ